MAKKYAKRLASSGCIYCRFFCYDKGQLSAHFLREHRDMTMGGADRPAAQVGGMWPCVMCPEKFLTREGLEHHSMAEHQRKIL